MALLRAESARRGASHCSLSPASALYTATLLTHAPLRSQTHADHPAPTLGQQRVPCQHVCEGTSGGGASGHRCSGGAAAGHAVQLTAAWRLAPLSIRYCWHCYLLPLLICKLQSCTCNQLACEGLAVVPRSGSSACGARLSVAACALLGNSMHSQSYPHQLQSSDRGGAAYRLPAFTPAEAGAANSCGSQSSIATLAAVQRSTAPPPRSPSNTCCRPPPLPPLREGRACSGHTCRPLRKWASALSSFALWRSSDGCEGACCLPARAAGGLPGIA